MKFKVDRVARGKPDPTGIERVHNSKGVVLAMVSKEAGILESNEAEVFAMLEVLYFQFSKSIFIQSGGE